MSPWPTPTATMNARIMTQILMIRSSFKILSAWSSFMTVSGASLKCTTTGFRQVLTGLPTRSCLSHHRIARRTPSAVTVLRVTDATKSPPGTPSRSPSIGRPLRSRRPAIEHFTVNRIAVPSASDRPLALSVISLETPSRLRHGGGPPCRRGCRTSCHVRRSLACNSRASRPERSMPPLTSSTIPVTVFFFVARRPATT